MNPLFGPTNIVVFSHLGRLMALFFFKNSPTSAALRANTCRLNDGQGPHDIPFTECGQIGAWQWRTRRSSHNSPCQLLYQLSGVGQNAESWLLRLTVDGINKQHHVRKI